MPASPRPHHMANQTNHFGSPSGFSLIEMLVVLVLIGIFVAMAIFYASAHEKLYKPDDESLKIADVLQEARQRSLTQREIMRVEVNLTDNVVTLYDENEPTTVDDDLRIRQITLSPQAEVVTSERPANIGVNPPEMLPVPTALFAPSIYPQSLADSVLTMRFLSNGSVVNAGNTTTGGGAVPTGVTLHAWAPSKVDPANSDIARAITIVGSTGLIKLWEYDPALTTTNKWKDSRRYGTFGGGAIPTPTP